MVLPRGCAPGWGPEVFLLLLPECSWHTCPPSPTSPTVGAFNGCVFAEVQTSD